MQNEEKGSGGVFLSPGMKNPPDPFSFSVSDLTEAELIARITGRLPTAPDWMVVGIGDDAAVVELERNRLDVLSVDALVDGVHFDRAFAPPHAIGHRAMAVNLSDLAAMGAAPRLALVSFALPHGLTLDEFDSIVDGFTALAARCRVTIGGGNLTRTPGPLTIDVTVLGTVKRRRALTRGGARPGDDLYVSGVVGGAAAGLGMLRGKLSTTEDSDLQKGNRIGPSQVLSSVSSVSSVESCITRYLYPEPRLRLGMALSRNRAATACIDLSDGLADAVRQVAEASGVGAVIDAGALPIDAEARRWFDAHGRDAVEQALASDDYELLIASRPRVERVLRAAARHGGVPLTKIGACTADRSLVLKQDGSDRPMPRGFTHFR